MLFNSFEFLIFFPLVTLLFFLLPHRYRWLMLLLASCAFYMFFIPVYIFILIFTIIIDYTAGICIERAALPAWKRTFLLLSLCANLGILAFFKYYSFINDNLLLLFSWAGITAHLPYLHIILPIGLSFHTFQAMSYTIEVYRGNQKAERHLGIYALFVMFYPQLVAGPIERPQNLIHQFHEKHAFEFERMKTGIQLMVWGLFKKVFIADRLGLMVNQVYNNPHSYEGIPLIVATVFFVFQVYCDFSGYSDIAIGAAQVMGFNLRQNFNRPFASKSISELWTRWHMSLSSWLRDYLYTPLAINCRSWGLYGILLSLMITFILIGLWHGANWTFIVFGTLHGVALCYDIITKKFWSRISRRVPSGMFTTFSILCTFGFFSFTCIFFRAHSLGDAFYVVCHLGSGILGGVRRIANDHSQARELLFLGQGLLTFLSAVSAIVIMELFQFAMQKKGGISEIFIDKPAWIRWSVYYACIVLILLGGVFNRHEFIYFQF